MRKTHLLFAGLLVLPGILTAQTIRQDIQNIRVRKTGDMVEVSFKITVEKMHPDEKLTYTPVLYNGDSIVELEPFSVSRRRRAISDSRTGDMAGMRKIVSRRPDGPLFYQASVPYRDWMQTVSADVQCVISGCCRSIPLPTANLADNLMLFYVITPHYESQERSYEHTELKQYVLDHPILHPSREYANRFETLSEDRRENSNSIRFRLASSQIDETRPENAKSLDGITRAIRLVLASPDADLKKIFIAGYASPEGSIALNSTLAQKRAQAIMDYLIRTTGLPGDTGYFELYNGGEDWKGLRELVASSNMAEKGEILRIIDSGTTDKQRKTALKEFGVPYGYMLKNFYPTLRNAGYIQIYYDEVSAKRTPGTVIGKSDGSVILGSDANAAIYNEALALMNAMRWEDARVKLLSISDDPAAANLLGVCYMMTGDYDTADSWFSRAAANGDPEAVLNLNETKTARTVQ